VSPAGQDTTESIGAAATTPGARPKKESNLSSVGYTTPARGATTLGNEFMVSG